MLAKTTASIAMTLALLLGVLPAAAADRSYERNSHERNDARLKELAHHLEAAARELYRDTRIRRGHRGWTQWRALRATSHFDRHARAFHARVEHRGHFEPEMRQEFHRLEHAFEVAKARVSKLRVRRELRRDLERVEKLMHRLEHQVAFRADRHEWRRYSRRDDARVWRVSMAFGH